MKTVEVFSQKGKKVDTIKLDANVFDGTVQQALMHQAVVTYLANQRQGLAMTKTRGQVRGGGAKPWRQKGTGRARVGSLRSPIWRGGGITFGPVRRNYSKQLPKRMKALALKSALNAKLNDKKIVVIDDIKMESAKTRELLQMLHSLKLDSEKIKIVVATIESNLKMSSNNLAQCVLEKALQLHAYNALDCSKLIFTKDALKLVQERIRKWLT